MKFALQPQCDVFYSQLNLLTKATHKAVSNLSAFPNIFASI